MKRIVFILTLLLCTTASALAQEHILGRWKTVDDKTGNTYAIIRIYKHTDGLIYGQIERLLVEEQYRSVKCKACKGDDYNKPIEGMIILRGMKTDGEILYGGKLLDPESGNFYYGKISVDKNGKLKLRGSIDKAGILGRSQYWLRVKE